MSYDLINPYNSSSEIISIAPWNQEIIIILLLIIAFCEAVKLVFVFYKEILKIHGGN